MHTNNRQPYALSYRLRSARSKKRSQKEDFEKQLIRIHEQWVKLRADKINLPWIPLAEPYQKGWKRYFVLREDVKRSNNAVFYESLLEKINTIQYSKGKAFKRKKWRKGRKIYEVKKQNLHEFSQWEWDSPKLKLTETEKILFDRKATPCPNSEFYALTYAYMEPWRFVLQIRPHMITHMKMIDEDLEREIQLLENYIEKNYLGHKVFRMTRGRSQNWRKHDGTKPKYRHLFKNKSLDSILDECEKEKI